MRKNFFMKSKANFLLSRANGPHHPPANSTPDGIMGQIPPYERRSQEHFPGKCGSGCGQEIRMPKLQKLQPARYYEDPHRNRGDIPAVIPEQKRQKTEENLIQHPPAIEIEPRMHMAEITLTRKPQRRHHRQGRQHHPPLTKPFAKSVHTIRIIKFFYHATKKNPPRSQVVGIYDTRGRRTVL